MTNTTIVWIRQDFRAIDHQALSEGAKRGLVVPLYIHDEQYEGSHQRGAASKW
jgi:deoxyribodipyrimidine photo-lyase